MDWTSRKQVRHSLFSLSLSPIFFLIVHLSPVSHLLLLVLLFIDCGSSLRLFNQPDPQRLHFNCRTTYLPTEMVLPAATPGFCWQIHHYSLLPFVHSYPPFSHPNLEWLISQLGAFNFMWWVNYQISTISRSHFRWATSQVLSKAKHYKSTRCITHSFSDSRPPPRFGLDLQLLGISSMVMRCFEKGGEKTRRLGQVPSVWEADAGK